MLAEPGCREKRVERGRERRGRQLSGADEYLAQTPLVLDQRRARRIGVLGFEPTQPLAANSRPNVNGQRMERGRGVQRISVESA